ncbi:hypothetical protein MSAN_00097100 [Mycena sanguinolenta]|uniref:Uncharacterized protein n=1 Tax=Mycena sanguinolenta TaxID=230812 RepID=A0A8H7DKJ6_9AGAR|nr:hypothetical protein MSAN_00097100 [Mycena sanguinolenta]
MPVAKAPRFILQFPDVGNVYSGTSSALDSNFKDNSEERTIGDYPMHQSLPSAKSSLGQPSKWRGSASRSATVLSGSACVSSVFPNSSRSQAHFRVGRVRAPDQVVGHYSWGLELVVAVLQIAPMVVTLAEKDWDLDRDQEQTHQSARLPKNLLACIRLGGHDGPLKG